MNTIRKNSLIKNVIEEMILEKITQNIDLGSDLEENIIRRIRKELNIEGKYDYDDFLEKQYIDESIFRENRRPKR